MVLKYKHKLHQSFMIATAIQAVLLVAALALSMVAKSETSRVRGFDVAASRLNADFGDVSTTLNRLYRELSDHAPSQFYVENLQQTMQEKIVSLQQSLAEISDGGLNGRDPIGSIDDEARLILKEITPRIDDFIARAGAFVKSDFETLNERFNSPSVVDLVAARNGVVLRSLNRLVENSRIQQQRAVELVHTGINVVIILLFVSLLGSWYWIIRPAIAKQKLAIQREIEFSASLSKKNTELQLAESHARTLYENAVRGVRARTEFLAVISHELRTPLNAILGFSEVMKNEIFGKHEIASYREYSNDIYRSGEHLLGIISDILQFTHLESDRCTLENTVLPLAEIFADTRMMAGDNAARKNIELVFRNDLPQGSTLRIDRRLLSQALMNLIDNAIKFSPSGSIVTIHSRRDGQEGVVISVTDQGIGIDPESASMLFQPFEQIESAFSRNSGGIGLGLSITKQIMVAHDGDVSLVSDRKTGSCFSLHLPDKRVIWQAGSPGDSSGTALKSGVVA